MRRTKKYVENALLMTGVSLLMRAVGMGFSVYLSAKIGAGAMGLFSLVGGIYGFAVTLASSGIYLGTTRLVSDALALENHLLVRRSMRVAFLYALGFGSLATLFLLVSSEPIGTYVLKESSTAQCMRILSLSLIPVAFSGAYSGYFTSVRRTYKNALTVLTEETVRISATVLLLNTFVGPENATQDACLCLVAGGTLADTFSFLFSSLLFVLDLHRHISSKGCDQGGIWRKLTSISLPVAISSYARSGLLALEHALIPIRLPKGGQNGDTAIAEYGKLHGMALPLVLFSNALPTSFASLLVPEVAQSKIKKEKRRIRYIAEKVYTFSLLYAIGAAGIVLCFSSELAEVFYATNPGVGFYIRVLAPLIPVMYLDTATDSLLKGLGEQVYSMNVNILDAGLSVVLVFFLLPSLGIKGYLLTVYITEILNAALSVTKLLSLSRQRTSLFRGVFQPIFCIAGATSLCRLLSLLSPLRRLPSPLYLTVILPLSLLFYILLLLATQTLKKSDAHWGYRFMRGIDESLIDQLSDSIPAKGGTRRDTRAGK